MRILHFSDIHLGLPPRSLGFLWDKRLLGTLNHWLFRRRKQNLEYIDRALAAMQALQPDWIVCTGDLGSVGSPEELRHAVAILRTFPLCAGQPRRLCPRQGLPTGLETGLP